MESSWLRLVLLVLGIALVAGIYIFDQRKRKQRSRQQHDTSVFDRNPVEVPDGADMMLNPSRDSHSGAADDLNDGLAVFPDADNRETATDNLSFAARDVFSEWEAGVKLPTRIIQLNIFSGDTRISGQMIFDVASELGMELGEFDIFHRLDPTTGKAVFSMANMLEPGTFDPDNLSDFKTPGVVLFTQFPAPVDCMSAFNEMLKAAERIGFIVGAEVQDENHNILTRQNIEHTRDSILEYRQKLQLALQAS